MGAIAAKPQSGKAATKATETAPFGNEAAERFLAKAERAQLMMDAAAIPDEQIDLLRLRETGIPLVPGLSEPATAPQDNSARLTRGQLVEVRSAHEIAATLDGDGKLDGVPFMPEMSVYCGKMFRVLRRADITCVEGHGLRRMNAAVFLDDVRCDGSAHDGCQRRCLIFWKEAWLRPVEFANSPLPEGIHAESSAITALIDLPTRKNARYVCQSTELAAATIDLPSWNLLPFISQVRDGELSVTRFVQIVALVLLNRLRTFLGFSELGRLTGPKSKSSQIGLGLRPGEWVRVKSHEEIKRTLNSAGRNRGLLFEPEMSDYSGQYFQMDYSIEKMIHEETGQMLHLNNTVALKGLTCQGLCAKSCPRSNYWFWREDWLERAPAPSARTPQRQA